jgi:diguanylate cyclase (GGDEF)-like protein/PAS domain S-box-containing protein
MPERDTRTIRADAVAKVRSRPRRAIVEGAIAGLVTFAVVLVAVSGVYKMAGVAAKQHLREGLASIAATASTTLDPVAHRRLFDPSMQASDEYNRAVAPLRKILRATPDLTYIYTVVLDDDVVRFVLDAAEPGDHDGDGREDQAQIWEEYVDPEPIIFDAFRANEGRGEIISSGEPYEDEWGVFVTGYAPFHNADGSLAGIVGVDMRADRYLAEAAQRRRTAAIGLIPGAALSMLIGFAVASIRRSQLLTLRTLETERKNAGRLALIAERTENAVVIANAQGMIEWINAGFERMTGYTLEEVRGRIAGPTLLGEGASCPEGDRLSDAIRRCEPAVAELEINAKNGRAYWARVEIQPLFESGRHTGFMAIQSDITERKHAEKRSADEAARFRLFVEQAPSAIAMFDLDMRYIAASRRWAIDYRLDECAIIGRSHYEVFPEIPDDWKETHRRCLEGETARGDTELFVRADGSEQWLSWEIRPWRDVRGEIGGIVMFTADISERVRNEKLLEQTSRIARVGGWEVDLRTMTPIWSPIVREIHAVPENFTPDLTSAIEFYVPEYRDLVATALRRAIEHGEPFDIEAELITAKGDRIWVQSQGEPSIRDGVCVRLSGVLRDITELKRAQDHLRSLSEMDRLTCLPNRARFTTSLREAVRDARKTGERLALLFFDFDRFKQVNDALGHAAGDALLVSVAQRFRESLMDGDDVARFGGDEFVVLLRHQTHESSAMGVAERLLNVFSSPHDIGGVSVTSTASIGLAMFEGGEDVDAEELLRRADAALYAAKDAGRNNCRAFDAELRDAITLRHQIDVAIRESNLTRDLRVLFEPVASVDTGSTVGYDVMIHLDQPSTRSLSSDSLLAAIDDSGAGLGCFLHLLARTTSDWRRLADAKPGFDGWISIPVSQRALAHPRLVDTVRGALRERPLNGARVRVRVPCTAVTDSRTNINDVLRHLRDLGLSVALDGFDGGVLSLATLGDRPIDAVLFDSALARGLRGQRSIAAVLNATINMAQNLGIAPIVVGLTERDQISALQSMNGEFARGPAIGAPLAIEQVLDALGSHDSLRAA